MKLEHIDNLSKGKKSGSNIGSRKTPHRLKKYEREIYEYSLKKGYLEIDIKDRVNLENLWDKVCIAKGWDNIILVKEKDNSKIIKNGEIVFEGTLGEGKILIKNI